jgi:hypothetical protein
VLVSHGVGVAVQEAADAAFSIDTTAS